VVVELSPPEVTFKHAEPTCVRAPAGAGGRPGSCGPSVQCFPFTIPGQPAGPAVGYAPFAGYAAPAGYPLMAPAGYAAPGYAPVAAVPSFAPAAVPMLAAPAGVGFPAPHPAPCGAAAGPGGFPHTGPLAGLGGLTSKDLEAMAKRQREFERMDAELRLADIRKLHDAVLAQAAAAGVAPPAAPLQAGAGGAGDDLAAKVDRLQQAMEGLLRVVDNHNKALEELRKRPNP
jgi:hypothetical protein